MTKDRNDMRSAIAYALACAACLAYSSGAAFSADTHKTDAAWIARCMAQLAAEHADAKARRVYCTCMHDDFEDNRPVTQTQMERIFPPAHLYCHRKAGW